MTEEQLSWNLRLKMEYKEGIQSKGVCYDHAHDSSAQEKFGFICTYLCLLTRVVDSPKGFKAD